MKLSFEEMRVLAERMRLNLSDAELAVYAEDIASLEALSEVLLPYSELLCEENTVCPLSGMRTDAIKPSLPRTQAFANAQKHNEEFLCVPRVVGEGEA